jgi:hypothetical protein
MQFHMDQSDVAFFFQMLILLCWEFSCIAQCFNVKTCHVLGTRKRSHFLVMQMILKNEILVFVLPRTRCATTVSLPVDQKLWKPTVHLYAREKN